MPPEAVYVVVSGPPASGKSTLAPVLARELGLPLVAKDTIKDALMSVLPVPDVEASRQLGRGAVAAMLAVAADSPIGAVIEGNFYRSVAGQSLGELPGTVVEVFCRCPKAVALERYRSRAGSRHAGHFDGDRHVDELWNDEVAEPVAAGWPLLEVNTAQPLDVAAVVALPATPVPRVPSDVPERRRRQPARPQNAGMEQEITGATPKASRQYERRPDWLGARLTPGRPRGQNVAEARLRSDSVRGARDPGGVQ